MPRESYVHPVTIAGEPRPRWVSVWRFRAALLALAVVFGAVAIVVVQYLNGNFQGQDPTFQPGGSGLNQQSDTGTVPAPAAAPSAKAPSSPRPKASTKPALLGGPG